MSMQAEEIMRTQPRLVRETGDLDYLHQANVQANVRVSAYEAYCRMTEKSSWPMRAAFWLRDQFCRLAGVDAIGGFKRKPDNAPPNVGEKLDFFSVEEISDTRLVLTVRDKHLDVMLSLTADPVGDDATLVSETSSVVTHNFFGRLYMIPVRPIHHLIVRHDLKKLAA